MVGGLGSGRPSGSGRDTVEACRSLDVNRLHREGCLPPVGRVAGNGGVTASESRRLACAPRPTGCTSARGCASAAATGRTWRDRPRRLLLRRLAALFRLSGHRERCRLRSPRRTQSKRPPENPGRFTWPNAQDKSSDLDFGSGGCILVAAPAVWKPFAPEIILSY